METYCIASTVLFDSLRCMGLAKLVEWLMLILDGTVPDLSQPWIPKGSFGLPRNWERFPYAQWWAIKRGVLDRGDGGLMRRHGTSVPVVCLLAKWSKPPSHCCGGHALALLCKARRQYLLTGKVSRYCIFALHGRALHHSRTPIPRLVIQFWAQTGRFIEGGCTPEPDITSPPPQPDTLTITPPPPHRSRTCRPDL